MDKFNLIFAGEIKDQFELNKVKLNFKNQFHLTSTQTDYLFSGKEITVKKALSQENALKFAIKIDDLGGVTYFHRVCDDITLPNGVKIDRRNRIRRSQIERRKIYRAGLSNDRRHQERRCA